MAGLDRSWQVAMPNKVLHVMEHGWRQCQYDMAWYDMTMTLSKSLQHQSEQSAYG